MLASAILLTGCKDWSWDFGKSYKLDSFPSPEAKGDYRAYADELVVTVFVGGQKIKDEKPTVTGIAIYADGKPAAIKPNFAEGLGTNGVEAMVTMIAPQIAKQVKAVLEVEYIQRIFQITIQFDCTAEANWVAGIAETKYLRKVEKENK
ncbi:MAG: hypothetical protein HZA50_06865 [Planctomycetes bacterium]|nr:hypothetical protein [Planctomycetota bacterium]